MIHSVFGAFLHVVSAYCDAPRAYHDQSETWGMCECFRKFIGINIMSCVAVRINVFREFDYSHEPVMHLAVKQTHNVQSHANRQ